MNKRVLVIGYYFRENFGDDLFQFVFENYIFGVDGSSQYDLTFVNFDDLGSIFTGLQTKTIPQFDTVIVGGGDVVNEYNLSPENVKGIRENFSDVPIIFFGVGLSYPDTLPMLDLGDYFFMRNKSDYEAVKYRYGSSNGIYIPDLAFYLTEQCRPKTVQTKPTNSIRKIGMCLPYPWFTNGDNSLFFQQLVDTINRLSKEYLVYLIPFDVSNNVVNSDLLLLERLKPCLTEYNEQAEQRIFYVTPTVLNQTIQAKLYSMIQMFNQLDCVVASRFHSVIFSVLTETPFVSLFTSRKIETLQSDLGPELSQAFVKAHTDAKGVPIEFDMEQFDKSLNWALTSGNMIAPLLASKRNYLWGVVKSRGEQLRKLIETKSVRLTPPQYISQGHTKTLIDTTVRSVLKLFGKLTVRNIEKINKGVSLIDIISSRYNTSQSLQQALTEEVLWNITGDPYAPYYYGLMDQVHKQPLVPQLEWIIQDYYLRYMHRNIDSDKLIMVNKNFQEIHRSGWQFIVDNVVMELNNTASSSELREPLIIDTYVDKTFHWNREFYQSKGMIPYTQKWVGFIHHTYSSYNNTYNCEELFRNETFVRSLEQCQCLIVMSNYLKRQIEYSLQLLYNHPIKPLNNRVLVEVIYHPSEETGIIFDWDRFINNNNKQLVQVGNWLRNVFAIYQVELPQTSIIRQKSVLKNRNCENYFLPPGFFKDLFSKMRLTDTLPNPSVLDICKISFENMHLKGMYQYIIEMENSVQVIEYLDNTKYDELLANNIIFINLVDASAVNTVMECALRNTPILVNPADAVVEVLGIDYPLYYNSMYEASKILDDPQRLRSGYEYLQKMDKSKFKIETFIQRAKEVLSKYI
ncbi:MAG: polysaccharide pyruvyl transferase family protein [Proteobacteria bacterium]|nr:polysaccharide pyruvyl transferase family protein [Pseudomonadota bacterium]NBP13774.1 polysaccharide pyruvyl transferase family protein [bacterium]